MSLPPALQNRNVQIGILAVAVIAVLVVLFMFVFKGNPAPAPTQTAEFPGGPGMPGGPPVGPGGPNGPGAPGGPPVGIDVAGGPVVPGGAPGPYGPAGPGVPGGPGEYGATPGAAPAQQQVAKKAGPKPPRRKDPFEATMPEYNEANHYQYAQQTQPPTVSDELRSYGVQPPQLYQSLRAEAQAEKYRRSLVRGIVDTADPPMRMAGVLHGPRVQGILEIAGESRVVRPGETIGPYRVERVEPTRIILSKPLPSGGRRRIDVPLQDAPQLSQQYQQPGFGGGPGGPGGTNGPGGFPGGPGGFPGPPGGFGGRGATAGS